MGIKELGHVVLYVRDIERSSYFYRDVLGFSQILPRFEEGSGGMSGSRSPLGSHVAAFSSGRTHHELLLIEVGDSAQPIAKGRRLGMYHIGLKVGDSDQELVEAWNKVVASGATVIGASDHTVTHSLYILDPDGNEIELYIDVPGVDWRSNPELIASPIKALSIA